MKSLEEKVPVMWRGLLGSLLKNENTARLFERVDRAYEKGAIFPPREEIFRALELRAPRSVKVVIVGQDPYHGTEGDTPQANGLAFSVHPGVKVPPSLRNIMKEVEAEFGHAPRIREGDLTSWAKQGVLLLNAVLSVEEGNAASHAGWGWEEFTDGILRSLSEKEDALVFMLWGAHARKKAGLIDGKKHLVLESAHPSPLSAHNGFFGNGHFKKANDFLVLKNKTAIDW